jgi:hypothetical protein
LPRNPLNTRQENERTWEYHLGDPSPGIVLISEADWRVQSGDSCSLEMPLGPTSC